MAEVRLTTPFLAYVAFSVRRNYILVISCHQALTSLPEAEETGFRLLGFVLRCLGLSSNKSIDL